MSGPLMDLVASEFAKLGESTDNSNVKQILSKYITQENVFSILGEKSEIDGSPNNIYFWESELPFQNGSGILAPSLEIKIPIDCLPEDQYQWIPLAHIAAIHQFSISHPFQDSNPLFTQDSLYYQYVQLSTPQEKKMFQLRKDDENWIFNIPLQFPSPGYPDYFWGLNYDTQRIKLILTPWQELIVCNDITAYQNLDKVVTDIVQRSQIFLQGTFYELSNNIRDLCFRLNILPLISELRIKSYPITSPEIKKKWHAKSEVYPHIQPLLRIYNNDIMQRICASIPYVPQSPIWKKINNLYWGTLAGEIFSFFSEKEKNNNQLISTFPNTKYLVRYSNNNLVINQQYIYLPHRSYLDCQGKVKLGTAISDINPFERYPLRNVKYFINQNTRWDMSTSQMLFHQMINFPDSEVIPHTGVFNYGENTLNYLAHFRIDTSEMELDIDWDSFVPCQKETTCQILSFGFIPLCKL